MLVGIAMVVSTLARGGGALALGVVLGTMLALIGAGRLWLARGAAVRAVSGGAAGAGGPRARGAPAQLGGR